MKNSITLIFIFLLIILLSGCAKKIEPTDICKFKIPVSSFETGQNFDYIDFFDVAIEEAKDHSFPPPMQYDKRQGLLVFGHKDVETMPGHKMVVYVWSDSSSNQPGGDLCINYQILDVKGSFLTETSSDRIIIDYMDELKNRYKTKIEDTNRLMKKYQMN